MDSTVTRPRQVLPNEFYLITRSCAQQQFLLRPDDEVNNAVAYCLGVAAERHRIDVILATVESNHYHSVIFDREGNYPRFIEDFHKLVARSLNKKWCRKENLWSCEETCVTRLLDHHGIMGELAYAAANPVKDRLVERAVQWPGLNGYRHLLNQRPLRARRPRFFFKRDSSLPAEVVLEFKIPAELGDREEILEELRNRVETIERETKAKRAGAKVLGVRAILQQQWHHFPASHRARVAKTGKPKIRPRFAGLIENRKEATQSFEDFLAGYRDARALWLAGKSCVFPHGTYWMAHFTPATRAPLITSSRI